MTVPVIRALSNQNQDLKITILTRTFFAPFFRDLENVTIFNADVNGNHKGLKGLYKLSKELRKFKFDAVADLHNVLRSNVLKKFLSVQRFAQIDKGRAEKKALISGDNFRQLKTTHERYADVFYQLGLSVDLSNPTFPVQTILNDSILKWIKSDAKQYIGIAPFAAFKSKMYSLELMNKVISELAKEYCILLFGGGKEEIIQLDAIAKQHPNVISVAGKLSLSEELDVISNLKLMVSMDSGNGHIAAMLGVKVVTIWGVTHPFAGFMPFNQTINCSLIVNRDEFPKTPTSVYGNRFPKDYEQAINSISPNEIIAKVKSLL